MFKVVKATTVEAYFVMLSPERREPMEFFHTKIIKIAENFPEFLGLVHLKSSPLDLSPHSCYHRGHD